MEELGIKISKGGGAAGGEKLKITNGNVEESQFHSRKSVKGKFSPP